MVIRELLVKLGIEQDSSIFKSFLAVEALKAGLGTLIAKAQEFRNWMVQGTVDAGYEAQLYASRLGLTADQTQRLAYVSRMANVTLEEMTHATRALAAKGITDINGALLKLADQFAKMPDNGRKLALAQEYLGRYGTKFIPVLNRGRAAMEGLMQEAEDLGIVMTGPALAATQAYGEEQRRLQASLEGLRNTIVLPLLPALTRTLERWIAIAHAIREFLAPVGKVIAQVRTLAIMLGLAALAWVGYTVAQYVAVTASLLQVGALQALVIWLWNVAMATVAAVAPWLAWAAAIAAAYLVIEDIVVFFMNGDSLIGRALARWIGPFSTWQEALQRVWTKVKTSFAETWDSMLADAQAHFGSFMAHLAGSLAKGTFSAIAAFGPGELERSMLPWFSGGASSPGAAAAIGGARTVSASASVTIQNLNVHGATGSPADTAAAVHEAVGRVLKSHYRGAAAAATGP
jgi:hypothetical protein